MIAAIQNRLLVMHKTITYGFIALTLLLLTGCWAMPLPSGQPEEFTMRKQETGSLLGSTSKEVQDLFGPPLWIAHKDNATYFIYQWRSADVGMLWIFYFPVWIAGGEDTELHCILMEFGENDILRSYKIDSEGLRFSFMDFSQYGSCAEVFGMLDSAVWMHKVLTSEEKQAEERLSGAERKLYREVRAYCKKADLGHADAQTYVGDLYYLGAYGLDKNLILAYVWYNLAAKNGNSYAAMQSERVAIKLSPQQLNKAQIQLEEWVSGQCKRDLLKAISEGNE